MKKKKKGQEMRSMQAFSFSLSSGTLSWCVFLFIPLSVSTSPLRCSYVSVIGGCHSVSPSHLLSIWGCTFLLFWVWTISSPFFFSSFCNRSPSATLTAPPRSLSFVLLLRKRLSVSPSPLPSSWQAVVLIRTSAFSSFSSCLFLSFCLCSSPPQVLEDSWFSLNDRVGKALNSFR